MAVRDNPLQGPWIQTLPKVTEDVSDILKVPGLRQHFIKSTYLSFCIFIDISMPNIYKFMKYNWSRIIEFNTFIL